MTRLIIIIIIAIAVFFIGRESGEQIKSETIIDTVMVERVLFDTIVKPVFRVRIKTDTVYVPTNIDSLFEIAKQHVHADSIEIYSPSFIAEKDTLYEDSLIYAKVSFVSRLPLDPGAYFQWHFRMKYPEIHKRELLTKPEGFWDQLGLGFGVGYGVDLKTGVFHPNISFGLHYRL